MTDRLVTPRFKEPKIAAGRLQRLLVKWGREVRARDSFMCRACGFRDPQGEMLSAHHLIFRSHCSTTYQVDVRNGLTLCNFAAACYRDDGRRGCHERVHAGELKIAPGWLRSDAIACLVELGLRWDDDGRPVGLLHEYFAPRGR